MSSAKPSRSKRSAPPTGPASACEDCAVCLSALNPAVDSLFTGPCGHRFHVQCAERNFVVGNARSCPLCRMPFQHAPGFVAMALAEAATATHHAVMPRPGRGPGRMEVRPEAPAVLPDVAPLPVAAASSALLGPGFATASCVMDVPFLDAASAGVDGGHDVTALLRVTYADDDDDAPQTLPCDYVLLADISGSMSGSKIASVRDALLKLSTMFGAGDRVALCVFDDRAEQATPLAPVSDAAPAALAAFRRAALTQCVARGGTDIKTALALATRILAARQHVNPAAHVLLLTDGQDRSALAAPLASGATWSTLGFGADHDAELLAGLAGRSRPRGTFTFVERDDLLDETLAAYTGDCSRVLSADARLAIKPAPGTQLVRVLDAPGAVDTRPDGSARIALGPARVAATVEVLVQLRVSAEAVAAASAGNAALPALSLQVTAAPAAPGLRCIRTPPLRVSFAPADAAARDAIATAHNRRRLAVAAAAVASAANADGAGPARSITGVALATDVIAAARSALQGTDAARALALAELSDMERCVADAELSKRRALETAHAGSAQRSLMKSPGKGGMSARYTMQCRKSAGSNF
jgi:hypothetical protein